MLSFTSRLHCLWSGNDALIFRYIYIYIYTLLPFLWSSIFDCKRPKQYDLLCSLIVWSSNEPLISSIFRHQQSGQIHFYNTRTQMKTSRDPRRSPEPPTTNNMSLDLELNLRCETKPHSDISTNSFRALFKNNSSRLGLEVDHDQEMMATVCMRCHMLVMLCKSSPACPNCKYMHTPDQSPSTLFKPLSQGHVASPCASKIKAWY